MLSDFNPRSREGSDRIVLDLVGNLAISIHAPAKGATITALFVRFFRDNFNPRSREGSDRAALNRIYGAVHFNPRSREGSDFQP